MKRTPLTRDSHGGRGARSLAVIAVAGALLLSGCSLDDDAPRPGAAARIDGVSIPLSQVDEDARARCEVVAQVGTTPQTGARVRDATLQAEVLRTIGEQLADEYDVSSTSYYDDKVEEVRSSLTGIDPDLAEAVLPSLTGFDYFVDIVQEVGRADLGLDGETDDLQGEGFNRGFEIFDDWYARHPLTTNPQFSDVSISLDGGVVGARDDLSVAQSDEATSIDDYLALPPAAAPQPGQPAPADPGAAYVESLPASQRCG